MTTGKINAANGNGRRKNLHPVTHTSTHKNGKSKPILITGGAGFIGTNLAHRLLSAGHRVRIFDSLARAGVEENLRWLRDTHGEQVEVLIADIRDADAVRTAAAGISQAFHLAA